MYLTDKLTELSIGRVNKQLRTMKESNSEKYDKTLEMFLLAAEVATHFLKESKEFRERFAKIHAEFLKYPESKQIIEESIKSYENFKKDQTSIEVE